MSDVEVMKLCVKVSNLKSMLEILEKDYNDKLEELYEENRKLKEEIEKYKYKEEYEEEIITCCECNSTQSHKKTKWIYLSGDTDTNISSCNNVWCCYECFKED